MGTRANKSKKKKVHNQAYIPENHKSMSMEKLQEIVGQLNCACKIIDENTRGTGFFCIIPFPDSNHLLSVLITCNHVFDPKSKREIHFTVNKKDYTLSLDDDRLKYTSKIYDITMIQIKNNDGLNMDNFLEIDENINEANIEDYCKNLSVYILHHELGRELKYSPGVIRSTEAINLFYTCHTEPGSSGGPIINSDSLKVFAIHKGYHELREKNQGRFIIEPIKEFYIINNGGSLSNRMQYKEYDNNKQYQDNDGNYIDNKTIFHEHTLKLTFRKRWHCNICKSRYQNTSSLYCNLCDFDVCEHCFLGKKTNQVNNGNNKRSNQSNKIMTEMMIKEAFSCFNQFNEIFLPQKSLICKYNFAQFNTIPNTIIENRNSSNIHEHSFTCNDCVNKICNNCLKEINGVPCHECNCNIILCLDCGFKILYGDKNNNFHEHNLILTYKNDNWRCNVCEFEYGSFKKVSFYCQQCNFNVCDNCYLKEEKEQVTPLEVNDNFNNKNEQRKSLIIEDKLEKDDGQDKSIDIDNYSIYKHSLDFNNELDAQCITCKNSIEKTPGYECKICNIILCLDCVNTHCERKNDKIFHFI
jgi:V8-like Glu-specific endopeptidase